jgi:hypothetical protein
LNGYKPFKVFYFKADYLNDTLVQKTMERASCQRTICSMAAGIGRGRAGSRAGIQETAEEAASSVRFSMSQVGDEVIEKGTGGVAKGISIIFITVKPFANKHSFFIIKNTYK